MTDHQPVCKTCWAVIAYGKLDAHMETTHGNTDGKARSMANQWALNEGVLTPETAQAAVRLANAAWQLMRSGSTGAGPAFTEALNGWDPYASTHGKIVQ